MLNLPVFRSRKADTKPHGPQPFSKQTLPKASRLDGHGKRLPVLRGRHLARLATGERGGTA